MYQIGRALSGMARLCSVIGTICIILMMLHVTADVVGRYVLNAPVPGTIVIVANYYMIFLVFIALGVAEEKRAHISVEFLTELMPKTIQGWLSIFSGLLTVAVFTLLLISGFSEAMKKTRSGAAMEQGSQMVEVWQSYWAIPVGAGLIALVALYRVVTTVTGTQSGLDETDESAKFIND